MPTIVIGHSLDGTGRFGLPIAIPNNTHLLNTDFFFQSCYGDPGAVQGVSATAGMRLRVR